MSFVRSCTAFVVAAVALAAPAMAANSVFIGSLIVGPNERDVHIPIYLENDYDLWEITCPLVIRSVSGQAFVTAVALGMGDRLTPSGPLSEVRFANHYGFGASKFSACKRFTAAQPYGFGGFNYPATYNTYEKLAVSSDPYGLMFISACIFGRTLAPGSDAAGSYWIDVDVNGSWGIFEIDTACVDPYNHLLFSTRAHGDIQGIVPHFTKGVITIMEGADKGSVRSVPLDQVFR